MSAPLLFLALWLASGARAQTVFVAPADGHRPVLAAIAGARSSVEMVMYHLTDPAVEGALIDAARRGVAVRVILDGGSLREPRFGSVARRLLSAGVVVRPSTPAFTITHEKALVVDGNTALIMSMNMTKDWFETRDYGVITSDRNVIKEWERVFETDWANALGKQGGTPQLTEPALLWSPVNSRKKLKGLAGSAKSTLVACVENLGDRTIHKALGEAAARGVHVRLIVPMCDINKDPLWNYPFLEKLAARGVQVKVMPYPATPAHPYMHAKMMLADHARGYIGSINFSANSTTKARELGVLFSDPASVRKAADTFENDWNAAVDVPRPPPFDCPLPR